MLHIKSNSLPPTIQEAPVLYADPEKLPVIVELKEFMRNNQLDNLKVMLAFSGQELLAMEGFGYRCLVSYMNTLEEHGCLGLFRETAD